MAVAQVKLSPTRFRGTVLAAVMALVLVSVVIIAIAVATASPLFRPQAGAPTRPVPGGPDHGVLRDSTTSASTPGTCPTPRGQLRTHFNRENGA